MAERAETSRALADLLRDAPRFIAEASLLPLRAYQLAVAQAVLDSVLQRRGLSFVVMFPRQSGKNELQAQLEAYLLLLFSEAGAEIVKVSPTWKPQSLNAMRRLQRVLETNRLTGPLWRKESGYIYRVGRARIFFLSGAPETNIVGATAGTLLEVDEAQDVTIAKFDKDIAPMAASTNATRVFWGTAWTASTLLARELRAARAAEQEDGIRRTFVLTADEVGDEVPAYRTFVNEQVRRLGRTHPLVRTQFFSEELDSGGGMFTAARRQLMTGSHPPLDAPQPGKAYALLLDAAGADEGVAAGSAELANPARDAAALTVVEVDTATQEVLRAPTYRVVHRRTWLGEPHPALFSQLAALAEHWRARWVVMDATGVGAGLAGFLEKALPGRVIPFTFNTATKSALGWGFLAVVDSGRFRDFALPPGQEHCPQAELQEWFRRQVESAQMTVLEGPERRMRWNVPDSARHPQTGAPLHDDLLISAALCWRLDDLPWTSGAPALAVRAPDPLRQMEREERRRRWEF